ncbi:DUF2249 domain-containing protein [Alsobacter sp. R-9]
MCGCGNVRETTIDVRQIVPGMRHPIVFGTFDMLQPGEAFVIVNDHDPQPLHHQFDAYRPGTFSWDYEVEGPQVWRVRIARVAENGPAGR